MSEDLAPLHCRHACRRGGWSSVVAAIAGGRHGHRTEVIVVVVAALGALSVPKIVAIAIAIANVGEPGRRRSRALSEARCCGRRCAVRAGSCGHARIASLSCSAVLPLPRGVEYSPGARPPLPAWPACSPCPALPLDCTRSSSCSCTHTLLHIPVHP